ncbi:MAG TPA: DUF6580 family putative transport protein [Chthoniobacterales bacterium]|jgi:hypothetical protein|nr:DUF6580 family putative transport protein [Chthoniobacterales bacterium]
MLPALVLTLVVTLYRVCYALAGAPPDWANFSPVAAILLCSAAYLSRKVVLLAALGPLVVADLLLNAHYHAPLIDTGMFSRYFCFALIILLGFALRRQHKYKALATFAGATAGSCLFFVVTNTTTWLSSPDYSKSFEGWWQALTIGLPGYPPTLFFFRNTLLSDLLFTALFLMTQAASAKWLARHSDAPFPEMHQTVAPAIHDYGNTGTSRRRRD